MRRIEVVLIDPNRCRDAKGELFSDFLDYAYHTKPRGFPEDEEELELRYNYILSDYEEEAFPGDRLFLGIAFMARELSREEIEREFSSEERRIIEAAIEYNFGRPYTPRTQSREILERADWRTVARILKKLWRKSIFGKCAGSPEIGEKLIGRQIDKIIETVEKLERGRINFPIAYRTIRKQLRLIDRIVRNLKERVAEE